jgi:hypothetical protein
MHQRQHKIEQAQVDNKMPEWAKFVRLKAKIAQVGPNQAKDYEWQDR